MSIKTRKKLGYCNSGIGNSGDCNFGFYNTGNGNFGNKNSGDGNSGDGNSGDGNSGDGNSGFGNKCNGSNGVFCTENQKIYIFNKPSGMTLEEFYESDYWKAICSSEFKITEWVEDEARVEGGYLKAITEKEAWQNWWNELSIENRMIIQSIPNFDHEIFEEITGICV